MDDTNSSTTVTAGDDDDDGNQFFEALDEFPFYDCTDFDENNQPISPSSSNVHLQPIKGSDSDTELHKSKLRPRRTFSRYPHTDISDSAGDLDDLKSKSSVSFDFNDARLAESARKFKFLRNLKRNDGDSEGSGSGSGSGSGLFNVEFDLGKNINRPNEGIKESSVITNENNLRPKESSGGRRFKNLSKDGITERSVVTDVNSERTEELNTVDSRVGEMEDPSSNVLFSLASLVIKAIAFQVHLLYRLITFPIWLIYSVCMFVVDPFRISRCCKDFVKRRLIKLVGAVYGRVSPMIYEWFKEHNYIWKLGFRFGWGLLWSVYVCVVLVSILVSAFMISGLIMRVLVEEPVHLKDTLNFDYTKPSPVAFVPVTACPTSSCGTDCREKIDTGKLGESRGIPPNHKMQVTVSLTLPESDYNRNLGIFQVRVDLLSADGSALSSLRQHSMLHFKSQPIRLVLTFLKIAPLLAGFYSETQVLNIKFRGLTEGHVPTACIKVIIEQRAEFRLGAGIPEVYDASLSLLSEIPLPRRILWCWKKTIFIWLSMTMFTMELLFTLLCCSPLILPRTTRRGNTTNIVTSQNTGPVQGS